MAIRLSCPSCNTGFTLPALPADRRATCPRCGDPFSIRTFTEDDSESATHVAIPDTRGLTSLGSPGRGARSPLRALMIALLMGIVGPGVGLCVYYSRDFKLKPPPGTDSPPTAAVTPAPQLEGLRYLPADTNIAFAVQPGPILAYAARTNQEPRELLAKAGIPGRILDTVTNLGLTLPQIDHIAGGTSVGDGAFKLRLTIVLVLRRPHADEEEFLQKLKAKKQSGGKARYDVELAGLPMSAARMSPTLWVFGQPEDLDAVDRGGYPAGGAQLPAGLAEMISQRVPNQAAVWVATNDERWDAKPGVKLVAKMVNAADWLPVVAKGRAGLFALTFDDPPRMRLFVRAGDETVGKRLRAYFQSKAAADERSTHGGAGEYALYDAPMNPAEGLGVLKQFLADAGKP